MEQLNLLSVERLVTDAIATLNSIKENPLQGGYMLELEATMKLIDVVSSPFHDEHSSLWPSFTLVLL